MILKDTTKVRIDADGKITGFATWKEYPDKIVFLAVALIGNRKENFRQMMQYIREFKKPVMVYSEKGKKWVSNLL